MTIEHILETMKSRFKKGNVNSAITYYFTFGENESDKWTLFLSPNEYRYERGKSVDSADCVLKCSVDMFRKMVLEGYMPGMTDMLAGRIKTNNPDLLKKLKLFFSM